MQQTSSRAAEMLEWLGRQQAAMLALLEQIVNTDSGSYDKAGVDRVGESLKAHYARLEVPVETVPHATYGEAIRATLAQPSANDQRTIVLMGHRDTVFPAGEAQLRPFTIKDGKAFGPGVCDMKSGLVMNAFVLEAFQRFGGHPGPLVTLVTGDEEIASPSSRALIEAEARQARAVFNSEPGRPSGNVVSRRKGGVFLTFAVTGKAAHSGGAFKDGISAIEELARKVIALHQLTDLERGTTLNVGLVRGGQTVNTVAPWAEGEVDLRYVRSADREAALAAIRHIIDTPSVAGTSATLAIKGEFLPLEETEGSRRLFGAYQAAAASLGMQVAGEFTGGCADSGFTSAMGCPTICAVGPVGGKAHTPEEYLEVASLVPRAQALALAILGLGEAGV